MGRTCIRRAEARGRRAQGKDSRIGLFWLRADQPSRCFAARSPRGVSQFALVITRASSDRTYPGGLPCFDRTSSQPPVEFTTLIRVPGPICEITRAADDGFS